MSGDAMMALLAEIERVAMSGDVAWSRSASDRMLEELKKHDPSAEAWEGRSLEWRFLLVAYARRASSRGYAGTAMRAGTIVNLPPDLAERVWNRASVG